MTGLALQIDGKWAVLSEGDSVNIENNSPVWGEGNSFSLPFELDIEANRHILGNADQITGQSVYEVLDGKRAVLYTLGIPVYYGKIKMEDEVELSEGKVDVTLVSGNLTFDEMIDGMNCQDVELLDRIEVGEVCSELAWKLTHKFTGEETWLTAPAPTETMIPWVDKIMKTNVTDAYPLAKYCNTRICYQTPEEDEDIPEDLTDEQKKFQTDRLGKIVKGKYVVLDVNRAMSGICFYVLYFLDCLFHKLNIDYSNENLMTMEDMSRLAFFSTRCVYDEELVEERTDSYTMFQHFTYSIALLKSEEYEVLFRPNKSVCIANSKNFPDLDVSEIIEGIESGFGIKFVYDNVRLKMNAYYVKDILKCKDVHSVNAVEVYDVAKVENKIRGFSLKYSGGDEESSDYNYTDWKVPAFVNAYNAIILSMNAFDKSLYYDSRNGNTYRVKVDKEATKESELNPSLVEVAAFNPAVYQDCSKEDYVESVEIGFVPIMNNDITSLEDKKKKINLFEEGMDDSANDQTFAVFLDVSMKYPAFSPKVKVGGTFANGDKFDIYYRYWTEQRYDELYAQTSHKDRTSGSRYINIVEQKSPIQDYDSGFTLGFMRGPGNTAGVEDFDKNYDNEGNYRYVSVASDYAFHSDYIDNYARLFDYNGTEPGGVDTVGRISLKIRSEKPTDKFPPYCYPITEAYAQRRGLFDKFYSEYAYFVVNRKIVRMKCRMEMADLLNIDWTKRYKIGEYVGFINKYSYSVSSTGISDVELEMYYI